MKRIPIGLEDSDKELLETAAKDLKVSIAEIIRALIRSYLPLKSGSEEMKISVWRQAIKARDKYKCFHCNEKFTNNLTIAHHVTPTVKGGKNTMNNGITLCRPCHGLAHNKFKEMYNLA